MNGDVILFRGKSLISKFIQAWTMSAYSHCGIVVWRGGEPRIVEARLGHVVRIRSLSAALSDGDIAEWVRFQSIDGDQSAMYAESLDGLKYASPLQFIRSFSPITSRLLDAIGWPSDVDPSGMHCSDLVIDCLRAGGLQPKAPPERSTPSDVLALPGAKIMGMLFSCS